ncbi:hypothetical protein AB4559_10750 [Vibrio sp. 10N.222.51.C8]|uniref:hypothetical protein n=1 Tax=Vibrio TaxID=662 RepID=UPI000C83CAE2|nr:MULTISPECIES: hypothetical protein [unclassified Vibrio]PMK28039.1 hypothetical protein BCU05_21060 [Vibrio sp. 10N.261.54.C3]PML76883.1 hypothetical protein BCT71_21490 [Vibrio sp. 10N.261.51.A7]PMO01237.1 hypothetical protein BCT21_09230 [Vibrio sp. 10N.222.55.F9]PMO03518.1 hypothetical protein BCT20_08240 [Vibrio sp. 10N.222.55.C12]PMO18092.1 hypothetical protein BCT17_05260 [Vibrio sp. 10N.222.54.F10]
MARPKSYADEDVIRIATQLSDEGRQPSGWLIKEALGRGKIASIQTDLERLIGEGRLPEIKQSTVDTNPDQRAVASTFELPVELQDMLSLNEQELGKILRDMTIRINDKAHIHYESLMEVRIRELDAKSDILVKAQAMAEQDTLDIEVRLQKQVERNELLEDQIDNLEVRLTSSKSERSDLIQTISQLTDSFNKTTEKAAQQQISLDELRRTVSDIDKAHTATQVKLEYSMNEANQLQSQLSGLSELHETTRAQLTETSTLFKSTQKLLNESDNQISILREENRELATSHRLLEKGLEEAENEIALLHEQKQRLENDLVEHGKSTI